MDADPLAKPRRFLACGLLVVAGLYVVSALTLVVAGNTGAGLSFAERSAAFGYLFASPLVVFSLLAALLVAGPKERREFRSRIAAVAAVLGGLALAGAVITFVAGMTATGRSSVPFGGVPGADRYVQTAFGLAHILVLALVAWFAVVNVRSFSSAAGAEASVREVGRPLRPSGRHGLESGPPPPVTPPEQQQVPPGMGLEASAPPSGWDSRFQGQPASMWEMGQQDAGLDEANDSAAPTAPAPPIGATTPTVQSSDDSQSGKRWWESDG